ncbi:MAG: hypothetical protein WCD30_12325 [Pseudolabrys sp.]
MQGAAVAVIGPKMADNIQADSTNARLIISAPTNAASEHEFCHFVSAMSAGCNVRFGSKADMCSAEVDVRTKCQKSKDARQRDDARHY